MDMPFTESVKAAIFDTFHCVHCGSVSPPEWISARKGTKTPYVLSVSSEAVVFLSSDLLVSKNDEICIKNEEMYVKNEEFCIENDEFCR